MRTYLLQSTFVALVVLFSLAQAYSSDHRLVTYHDTMTIYNSTDPTKSVYDTTLYSFPFITDVSRILIFSDSAIVVPRKQI